MLACLHDIPWIILGDFNIIRDPGDSNSTNPNLHYMLPFNDLINDLDLHEIQLFGRQFSWSNKRPIPSLSKLDRTFLSNHWAALNTHIPFLSDLPTPTSDHVPLTLRFKDITNQRHRTFFFERHWLQFTEAQQIVHSEWHSVAVTNNPANDLLLKFKRVRHNITKWASCKFNGFNKLLPRTKHILHLLDRVEEHRTLSQIEFTPRVKLREHAYHLTSMQETKWRQRSAALWLKHGRFLSARVAS
jgi:hypothetical protein